ncbi:MAG: DUF4935 domain-containing protein [Chloroflexi bacterium]|nr:DUF4935 domain-containing protein [Chloroflexota bacterium]
MPKNCDSTAFVIDTSVIEGDFRLRSRALERVAALAKAVNVSVFLPEVAVGELVRHFKESLPASIKKADQAISDLNRYAYDGSEQEIRAPADSHSLDYRRWLIDRAAGLGIQELLISKGKDSEVLDRALARRRPFSVKDLGYKDTLIWLSILDLFARQTTKVVFMSSDSDYREGDNLHSDLVDDLKSMDIPEDSVVIVRNLQDGIIFLEKECGALSALID